MNLYVYCHDVDRLFQQATSTGAQILLENTDQYWGDRMCSLSDLDEHHWNFATHLHDFKK